MNARERIEEENKARQKTRREEEKKAIPQHTREM